MIYQAYSHTLHHKGKPFRFSTPAEYGALCNELDAMLVGFGIERDEEEPEGEGDEGVAAAAAVASPEPPLAAVVKPSTPSDTFGDVDSDEEEEEEEEDEYAAKETSLTPVKQYKYIITNHKVVLAQLTSELENFKDFVKRIFMEEDVVTLQRLKDGVETGKLSFYEVIVQIRKELEIEAERKLRVARQIEMEKRRVLSSSNRTGPARLAGGCCAAALKPLTMEMEDDDTF
eukprot:NODE_1072_length_1117_cov_91.909176_g821_i0.p1 GENE.NODE_1072_length_1117_cov_91.909176_g821_i0~~NODE_1072_length_1117_cov_91.909176_g821_i0.p1  ORF type:complete len:230 (+),score=64.66 NODE_1072_length_1117_cov_91.909176_g821_i0:73-762(+)